MVRRLLEVKRPFANHNSLNSLCFRPADGALLWANGDGGGANDPYDLARDPHSVMGKLLALDVNARHWSSPGPLTTIAELPCWVTVEAYGLRNPVSLTLAPDRETFALAMAGQDTGEFAFLFRGTNHDFGWPQWEGGVPNPAKPPTGEIAPFSLFLFRPETFL
jgi:glucose/arabinose dehydrogenase